MCKLRAGAEPGAAGGECGQGDGGDSVAVPAAARAVGGQQRDPPWGPQCAQRPHVHRQVHPGAAGGLRWLAVAMTYNFQSPTRLD